MKPAGPPRSLDPVLEAADHTDREWLDPWRLGVWKHPAARSFGRFAGRLGKRVFNRGLKLFVSVPASIPLAEVRDVEKVLVVRPNFRIGNTLIATPLISAVRRRFPGARLDYLCADTTAPLLWCLPVDRVHVLSRLFLTRPWGFFSLFARLRRERYDVALEGGMGSFSGALYAYLAGARYRIGCDGNASPFLNVRLSPEPSLHAYDGPAAYARALGVSCPSSPLYVVSDTERDAALSTLRETALAPNGVPSAFIVLCIGGHYDKRWPTERWIELVRHLSSAGVRMVVSLGPEDKWLAPRLQKAAAPGAHVIAPESVRAFAALCMHARLLITPDSGPMHLGAALRVPTLALLQTEASLSYCPRGKEDRNLVRPSAAQVVETLRALPVWSEIRART